VKSIREIIGSRKTLRAWLIFAVVVLWVAAQTLASAQAPATFEPPGPNIALGKSYTLDPAPNYKHCTDDGDLQQLTDGDHIPQTYQALWGFPGCVGWTKQGPVAITLDLGD